MGQEKSFSLPRSLLKVSGSRKHLIAESAVFFGLNVLDLTTTFTLLHAPCVPVGNTLYCPTEGNSDSSATIHQYGFGGFALGYGLYTLACLGGAFLGGKITDTLRENHPIAADTINTGISLLFAYRNIPMIAVVTSNLLLMATHPMF